MGVLVADTLAGLGTPGDDGAHGLIRTANVEEALTWNAAQQVWIGKPKVSMRINDIVGLGITGADLAWKYPGSRAELPAPVVNPVVQNFRIHKVNYGGELWAAGLRLQEHLSGAMQINGSPTSDAEVALAWYPLAEGDSFLTPESFNHGVRLVLDKDLPTAVYHWCSTGWQNNVTTGDGSGTGDGVYQPPAVNDHLYPEIYEWGTACNLRNFTALHRWVGGPGRGAGGNFEIPSKFPPASDVRGWYSASTVGALEGQGVDDLPDFSGRGQSLRQPTSAKRPVVMRDGSLGNKLFLRFDGTNDLLGTDIAPIPLKGTEFPPLSPISLGTVFTVYIVLRQRAAGGVQQIWLGPGGSGAPLIFRADATNQVNLWYGGTDVTYNRSGSWPSPWMILSVATDGSTLTAWENAASVVSGATGGATWAGLRLGNSFAEDLPAAIDVAEIIMCVGNHSNAERTSVINYLNNKYAIF